jgi:RNA-directed DNA polymerase
LNPYSCTLYNCKSLNKLKSYLNIEDDKYFKSLKTDLSENSFKFFRKFEKNERELFRCNTKITQIHERLIKLFNIEKSEYLKSGVKKESHITNALAHKDSNFFLLVDIKGFYPSTTKSKIKKQLIMTYQQSSNVAEFISNAVTVPQKKANDNRALVTGSVLSQYFAYVINKKMFDELYELSKLNDVIFTVYVDDISFSSKKVLTYKFHQQVYNIIKRYGYTVHNGKVYRGKINNKSKITGVHITKYGFRLLKKHKEKIKELKNKTDIKSKKSLLGMLNFAIQVNPKYRRYKKLFNHII